MNEFQNISPLELTRFVSFYRDEENRKLDFDSYNTISMQHKQAEGSAFLFNLLNEKKIALLADEVGMGKTIQSLAVCAALWQQKPDARILVLAPRNEIAFNWLREYETFVNVHYKVKDDIVKSRIAGKPINPAVFCSNLYDLVTEVQKGWGKLFIGKISSFSGLFVHSNDGVNERLKKAGIKPDRNYNDGFETLEAVVGIADLIRADIIEHLPEGFFDLVIIDEAHYFRNVDGASLRVNVAKRFFSEGESRINKRTLLLTATPNHTSSSNVKSIVSYFDDGKYKDAKFDEILEDICLRRFRRLSEKGKVKYNYRREMSRGADFQDDRMSELFFGIYQKQLVSEYVNGMMHGSKRNILGFLEGTEFIPKDYEVKEDEREKKEGGDYTSGADGKMLVELSAKYQSIFDGAPPSHPKYELLNRDLIGAEETLKSSNSKKLVFVRRIPSVKEIAARAIYKYDEILMRKISQALGINIELISGLNEFRKHFENKSGLLDYEDDEGASTSDDDLGEDIEKVPTSKVLYLFKTLKMKQGVQTSTHASKFRLRFNRSKPSVFNVFFAPGANYFDEEYHVHIIKSKFSSKGYIDDYFKSFVIARTESDQIPREVGLKIRNTLVGRIDNPEKSLEKIKLKTLMTIFWNYLKGSQLSQESKEEIVKEYQRFSYFQKEAISGFIEKGILLASPAIVDLYIAFIKASKLQANNAVRLYSQFSDEVEKEFANTAIPGLIIESILNFKVLCEKVFGLTTEDQLLNEEWKNFWDAQPAYAYSGDTKNNRVMASFNTPFFPDILISTSVLQEGVNLQYFCDEIYHYGIAWTPGDNEQRVGRIDRMFSKTERNLNLKEDSTLDIIYPYLKNTIDQDHLANFISKKYLEENLIDKCHGYAGNSNLDPSQFNFENWKDYFRTPNQDTVEDPYPAKSESLLPPSFQFIQSKEESNIVQEVINTFSENGIPFYQSNLSEETICVLDPTLSNERKQPVVIQLNYDAQLTGAMGEVTYTLSLITPIGNKKQIRQFEEKYVSYSNKYEQENLSVKLCLDESQNASSIFGIYARIELPVFVNDKGKSLSSLELMHNYYELITCADYIELIVLNDDLPLESLQSQRQVVEIIDPTKKLRSSINSIDEELNWSRMGDFVFLEHELVSNVSLRNMWERNHILRYVKHLQGRFIIPYYSKDIQQLEVNALEEIARMNARQL